MPAKKARPIDLTSSNCYYHGRQTTAQENIYRVFVERHNISIETVIECLETLRTSLETPQRAYGRVVMLKEISMRWEDFLKIVTEKTGKTFTKNPNPRRERDGYSEWWNARNLDGSFAYNGVTDDF